MLAEKKYFFLYFLSWGVRQEPQCIKGINLVFYVFANIKNYIQMMIEIVKI